MYFVALLYLVGVYFIDIDRFRLCFVIIFSFYKLKFYSDASHCIKTYTKLHPTYCTDPVILKIKTL